MKLPEDKRMHGLACMLSSPQEERKWHPSQPLGTALVHILHGKCLELVAVAVEDSGVTNWGQSPHPGTPFYPVLSRTGKALVDMQTFPGWTWGNRALFQPSLPFSSPHQPRLSTGKPGHSSKRAAQSSLEIFGHVAHELAALSEL